jgi:hypothetical protein
VLKTATHELKDEFIKGIPTIKSDFEDKRQFGLSKFFDFITVTAVGSCGMVLTMNEDMYSTYEKRIDEIEQFIYNEDQKIGKIFLIEQNQWMAMRPKYIEQLKNPTESDIFNLATEVFGTAIVNKI